MDRIYTVYKATSPSHKVYVGMTKKTLGERRREHEWHCKTNKNKKIFYSALCKYALDFSWEVLETDLTKEEAEQKEIFYIALFNATDRKRGYNQASGGLSGNIMTKQSRDKWRSSMQKYYADPDYCKKVTQRLRETKTKGFQDWLNADSQEVRDWKKGCSDRLKRLAWDRNSRLKRAKKRGGKPFICVETDEKFELLQDAADKFGVDKRNVHNVLRHPNRYKLY